MSQLSIDKKRGVPKPSTPEERETYREHAAARRQQNVVNAREILERNSLEWIEFLDQTEPIFMINYDGRTLRYRPTTGKWVDREGCERYGCRNLVRYLKGQVT